MSPTTLRGRQLLRQLSSFPASTSTSIFVRAISTSTNVSSRGDVASTAKPSTEAKSSDVAIPDLKDVAVAAEVVSGAPSELRHRLVRIYQPTRNTMQSGGAKGEKWRIDWDVLSGAGRWQNSLMGWASSADYMQGTRVLFNSKEDAVHFAEKQGWDYYVQPPTVKRIPPKNYSENFLYRPNKLRILRTK